MMEAKAVIVLLVFFFHLCNPASSHPLSHTLPTVHLQANPEYRGKQEHLNNAKSEGNIISHPGSKFGSTSGSRGVIGGGVAGSRGVNGGEVTGAGGESNGGGSQSTNTPGGAAVIPIYAAGAANSHRNNHHHSAGSRIHLSIGSSTLTGILLAYHLLLNPF